jgi:hypothetical protein
MSSPSRLGPVRDGGLGNLKVRGAYEDAVRHVGELEACLHRLALVEETAREQGVHAVGLEALAQVGSS